MPTSVLSKSQRKNLKRRQKRKAAKKASPTKSLSSVATDNHQSGFAQGHGGYFGDLLGGLGSKLGDFLQDKAKKLIGLGDYKDPDVVVSDHDVDCNSLCAGTQAPMIKNLGPAFIFRHREYVTDINSSVAFTNQSFLLNPGNNRLFTWLSAIAAAFEEYAFLGAIAEYKPLISLTSTNANGAVVFATEYNVTKPNFTSKVAMENYEYATSCAPYQSMFHAIECAPGQTAFGSAHRYVLSGSVPTGQDPKTYFLGNLQLATQGQASASVIGEFWLTYEIAFYKPLYAIGQGLNLLSDHYVYQTGSSTSVLIPASGLAVNPLSGLLGSSIAATGAIVFPPQVTIGTYLIVVSMTASGGFTNALQFATANSVFANCALLALFQSNTGAADQVSFPGSNTVSQLAPAAANMGSIVLVVSINAPGAVQATINLNSTLATGGGTVAATVFITQINGNIVPPL